MKWDFYGLHKLVCKNLWQSIVDIVFAFHQNYYISRDKLNVIFSGMPYALYFGLVIFFFFGLLIYSEKLIVNT